MLMNVPLQEFAFHFRIYAVPDGQNTFAKQGQFASSHVRSSAKDETLHPPAVR
jgi:hypothetical protein